MGTLSLSDQAARNVGIDPKGLHEGGGGSGDVVGPDSATDGNLAVFDGITGKLIKDGGAPGGGGGNVSVIDLGIIQVADVIAAGQLELLPFTPGRIIRRVYFSPDGFIPVGSVGGGGAPLFFTSPNTALQGAFHYGDWNTGSAIDDTIGSIQGGDTVIWKGDGTWDTGYSNVFLDNGPLILAHDFFWIDTTTDKPSVWAANTDYALAEYVIVGGNIQLVTTPGTTGSTEPTWNVSLNGTTDDGTIQWTNQMAADVAGAIHVRVEVEDIGINYPRPVSLEFLQQPTDVAANATIDPAVTVRLLDQNGDPFLFQPRDVALRLLGSNAGAATLSGTVDPSTDITTGIATSGDLSVDQPGTYRILARLNAWGVPYMRLVSDPFVVTSSGN